MAQTYLYLSDQSDFSGQVIASDRQQYNDIPEKVFSGNMFVHKKEHNESREMGELSCNL